MWALTRLPELLEFLARPDYLLINGVVGVALVPIFVHEQVDESELIRMV